MELGEAIEVFVKAFALGRSRIHPYVAEQMDGLWVMHDTPGKKWDPRKTEVVSHGFGPEETVRRIRGLKLGWHFLCEVHPDPADYDRVREEYKRLGYRAMTTEWMFIHSLDSIPEPNSKPPARWVESPEMFKTIRQNSQKPRRWRPEGRMYSVWDDTGDRGWVTSVPIGEHAWVSDLFVYEQFRGHGYGRSLMSRMLKDDREHGVQNSVLLASKDGARLYPHLGYEQIAVLQLFCPKSRVGI